MDKVEDYTMDGKLIMRGFYSKSGYKDGEFVFYYPSGKVQAQGRFHVGLRTGIWKYFFENGKIERVVKFPVQEEFSPMKIGFTPVSVYDSLGNLVLENETGHWHFEYQWVGINERFVIDGKFEKGKKEGEWICKLNGDTLYSELYSKDKFESGYIVNGGSKVKLIDPIDNKFMLPYKFEVTENFIYQQGITRDVYPFFGFLPFKQDSLQLIAENQQDTISDVEEVFFKVDQAAEFPGGMKALYKFLQLNQTYPASARQMKIQGKVFVAFVVDKEGSISNIKIRQGVNADLDSEAIRIVRLFPKWKPAMKDKTPVKSQFVLPIFFKLDF